LDFLHLCKNIIQNSYLINSLTITGQGEVTIDCGAQYFMELGSINTGRIVNVKVENLTVRGGVSDIAAISLLVASFSQLLIFIMFHFNTFHVDVFFQCYVSAALGDE
jgi:hypothetical protein